jgi:hypothetical protein
MDRLLEIFVATIAVVGVGGFLAAIIYMLIHL